MLADFRKLQAQVTKLEGENNELKIQVGNSEPKGNILKQPLL